MKYSPQQQQVIDFVINKTGNLVVEAAPGSGKTTTAFAALAKYVEKHPSHLAGYMAFNNSIQNEAKESYPLLAENVHGIHKYFYALLRKATGISKYNVYVNNGKTKYWQLAYAALSRSGGYDKKAASAAYDYANAVSLIRACRLDLSNPESYQWFLALYPKINSGVIDFCRILMIFGDIFALPNPARSYRLNEIKNTPVEVALKHGVNPDELESSYKRIISDKVIESSKKKYFSWITGNPVIDFVDMIALPLDMGVVQPEFNLLICDESQDFSRLYGEAVRAASRRLVIIGDSKQSLYLFAGAASNSMEDLRDQNEATELPLSVSFRCPTSHIEYAQVLNPNVDVFPENPAGEIVSLESLDHLVSILSETTSPSSLVMGRTNIQLIRVAMRLFANSIPFNYLGTDFVKDIMRVVDPIYLDDDSKPLKSVLFLDSLETWYKASLHDLIEKKAPRQLIEILTDTYTSLAEIYMYAVSIGKTEYHDFKQLVYSILSPKHSNATIVLSTIHKAKGREAAETVVLDEQTLPFFRSDSTEEEEQQEVNAAYVALTRCTTKHQSTMYFAPTE